MSIMCLLELYVYSYSNETDVLSVNRMYIAWNKHIYHTKKFPSISNKLLLTELENTFFEDNRFYLLILSTQ